MPVAPPQVVASPVSPAGRRHSILDAANGPLDLPGNRLAGVRYEAPWCASATARDDVNCSPGPLVPGPGIPLVEGAEFIVEAALECLTVGKPWDDTDGVTGFSSDLRAVLEATEHVAVEDHVADTLAGAAGLVDLGTVADVVAAVSALEAQAYSVERYGLRAKLHVPVALWAYGADRYQWDVRTAPTWSTKLGSIAVPNAALPDDTMYVTGQFSLWRAASPWMTDREGALDRITNEWRGFIQRDWAAAWECFTAVVTVGEVSSP
jgi:hypothetical protein